MKREHRSLTRALRQPMAEMDGHGFVRETLVRFATLFAPTIARLDPSVDATRRGMVLVSALEGAISHAAFESPAWLDEPWFLDDLVRLALGTLGVTGTRRTARAGSARQVTRRPTSRCA